MSDSNGAVPVLVTWASVTVASMTLHRHLVWFLQYCFGSLALWDRSGQSLAEAGSDKSGRFGALRQLIGGHHHYSGRRKEALRLVASNLPGLLVCILPFATGRRHQRRNSMHSQNIRSLESWQRGCDGKPRPRPLIASACARKQNVQVDNHAPKSLRIFSVKSKTCSLWIYWFCQKLPLYP
jgi:hypothetical protein